MSQLALDLGVPSTLVTEAVYARRLTALKDERVQASKVLRGPRGNRYSGDRKQFIEQVRQALYASKICSYAQGFVQLQAAAKEHDWPLNYGSIALLWRGGCIIRAAFLERIKEAFDANKNLDNLLLAPYFAEATAKAQDAWRNVIVTAAAARHLGAGLHDGLGLLRWLSAGALARQSAAGPTRLFRCAHLPAHRPRRDVPHRMAEAAPRSPSKSKSTLSVSLRLVVIGA